MLLLAAALLGAGIGLVPAPGTATSEGFIVIEPGVRLYYRKLGDGRQVVVSPLASWLAEPLASLARKDRTLIFYDTRGRGRSDRVDASKVSFANELSDLDSVRRHFGLEKMALMGWSHYGMMTAVYAIQHPDRVTRVVQITPGGPRSDPYLQQGMQTIRSRVDGEAYQAVQEKKKGGAFDKDPAGYCRAMLAVVRPAFFGNPADTAKMTFDECAFENEWPENQENWWGALFASMTPWNDREGARSSRVPRLVIQGEKDFIPLEGSREWVAGNPNARLLVIAGVGHHPFVEKPEIFLSAVGAFLDGRWPEGAEEIPAAEPPKPTAALAKEAREACARGDERRSCGSIRESLVAIQDRIEPNRVIRLALAPDSLSIARARILEMNHPAFDEPTLGVVADGRRPLLHGQQPGRQVPRREASDRARGDAGRGDPEATAALGAAGGLRQPPAVRSLTVDVNNAARYASGL